MRGLLLLLVGCGRLSFDTQADGGSEIPSCVARWLAGDIMLAPTPVPNVNTSATEVEPFVDADGDTLYFASGRQNAADDDIYKATASSGFTDVVRVPDLSTVGAPDGLVQISRDGLVATVTTGRTGTTAGGQNLWQVTRSSRGSAFSGFTADPFINVNTSGDDFEHWTSPDGLRLYVSSAIGSAQHIRLATRDRTDVPFGAPVDIPELDSPTTECCHSLTDDERVIVFTSLRGGAFQLFFATRASRMEPFSTPRVVPSLIAPSGFDLHTALTPDACRIYLSSTRPGLGAFDLWTSEI